MSSTRMLKIEPWRVKTAGFEYHSRRAEAEIQAASLELITSILHGIEQGDAIPPVRMMLHEGEELCFDLLYSLYPATLEDLGPDGGHHRLLAHRLGRHPLVVELFSEPSEQYGGRIPEAYRCDAAEMNIVSRRGDLVVRSSCMTYRIPAGLRQAGRHPSAPEIEEFFTANQRVTTGMILRELYGI